MNLKGLIEHYKKRIDTRVMVTVQADIWMLKQRTIAVKIFFHIIVEIQIITSTDKGIYLNANK